MKTSYFIVLWKQMSFEQLSETVSTKHQIVQFIVEWVVRVFCWCSYLEVKASICIVHHHVHTSNVLTSLIRAAKPLRPLPTACTHAAARPQATGSASQW